MASNPYIVGNVTKHKQGFIGRSETVSEIINALSYGKIITIYGQRRIGKTSILSRVEAILKEPASEYFPVNIDMQGKLENDINQMAILFSKAINRKCKLGKAPIENGKNASQIFKSIWLREAITQAIEKENKPGGIVLMLDEFDDVSLASISKANSFYKYLKDIADDNVFGLKIVVVLGRDPKTLLDGAQALLKRSKEFRVSLMTKSEIFNLIDLSKNSLEWSEGAKEEIWTLTKGQPYISQSICYKIWHEKHMKVFGDSKPIVAQSDIVDVFSYKEFGHIINHSWEILLPEEQVIVCFLASSESPQHESDLLNFIESFELMDSYSEPPLYKFLTNLKFNEWIEENKHLYEIKIPVYRTWVRNNHTQRDLVGKLFNIKSKAVSLALQAQSAKDLPKAINLLTRSVKLDPDNEVNYSELIRNITLFIKVSMAEGNNKLALQYVDRLATFNPSLAVEYRSEITAKVQTNLISQKIEYLLREKDFLIASAQAGNLMEYNRQNAIAFQYKIASSFLITTAGKWLTGLLFWTPIILIAISMDQKTFPAGAEFHFRPIHITILLITLIASFTEGVAETLKVQKLDNYISIGFFSFGVAYIFLGLYLIVTIPIHIKILTGVLLGETAYIKFSTEKNSTRKFIWAYINFAFVGLFCFSGDLLLAGNDFLTSVPSSSRTNVKNPIMVAVDLIKTIVTTPIVLWKRLVSTLTKLGK